MKTEATLSSVEAFALETPIGKAGSFLAYDVRRTIEWVDDLWLELQEIDSLDNSAITAFGMLVAARLRAVLSDYQKRLQRADS
jgi:hypothetical protein